MRACHDHKFDPIPARTIRAGRHLPQNVQTLEHANVSKWMEVNLPLPAEQEAPFAEYEAQYTPLSTKDRRVPGTTRQHDGRGRQGRSYGGLARHRDRRQPGEKGGRLAASQSVKPYSAPATRTTRIVPKVKKRRRLRNIRAPGGTKSAWRTRRAKIALPRCRSRSLASTAKS